MRRTTCFILLLAITGCGVRRGRAPAEVERLPRLETVKAELGPLSVVRSYTATVEPFEKAELCAQVRGYVKSVAVDIGQTIKQNDVLLTLDIPDVVAERDNKKAMHDQSEKLLAQAAQA